MSAPVLGNLRVDSVDAIARIIAARVARLSGDDRMAYVLLDHLGNIEVLRPTMRDTDLILCARGADLIGTYAKAPASAAMVELITGDLEEAMRCSRESA